MSGYDKTVLECFLKNQGRLFPMGDVASDEEEAAEFLEDCMAVVVHSPQEVLAYFEEEGVDLEGAGIREVLDLKEVFAVGDGRYLIVEG